MSILNSSLNSIELNKCYNFFINSNQISHVFLYRSFGNKLINNRIEQLTNLFSNQNYFENNQMSEKALRNLNKKAFEKDFLTISEFLLFFYLFYFICYNPLYPYNMDMFRFTFINFVILFFVFYLTVYLVEVRQYAPNIISNNKKLL